jgi:hypothetical protein
MTQRISMAAVVIASAFVISQANAQASVGFDATGFPDQLTLWRLMRSEPGAEQN